MAEEKDVFEWFMEQANKRRDKKEEKFMKKHFPAIDKRVDVIFGSIGPTEKPAKQTAKELRKRLKEEWGACYLICAKRVVAMPMEQLLIINGTVGAWYIITPEGFTIPVGKVWYKTYRKAFGNTPLEKVFKRVIRFDESQLACASGVLTI